METPEELGTWLYEFCNHPDRLKVEHILWRIPILLIDTRSKEACIEYYRKYHTV